MQSIGKNSRMLKSFVPSKSKETGLAVVVLLLAGAGMVRGQVNDPMPQRGIYPNGAYAFDRIESINQVNGLLTLTIPITTMPLGRAGMTVPVNLTYSSALADAYEYADTQAGQPVIRGAAQTSAFGGWRFAGFSYALYEVYSPINNCVPYVSNGKTVPQSPPPFQFGVIMPDGAHHILKLYGQNDPYQNNTFWYSPVTGQDPCTQATLPSPLTYFTADGSYIRVEVDNSNPTQYSAGGPWKIFLPDGTLVTGNGWDAWANGGGVGGFTPNCTIQDRNGNSVTVSTTTQDVTTLTDDEGRTITIDNNAGTVTQSGFNGSTLGWKLGTRDSIPYQLGDCPGVGNVGCGGYTGGGPASLQLPSDNGTLQYTFGYDPTYGELTRVTLPSGASTTYSYMFGPPVVVGTTSLNDNLVVSGKQVAWTDQADGGSTARQENWTYNYSSIWIGGSCSGYCTQIVAPDGGVSTTVFFSSPISTALVSKQILPDGSTTENSYKYNPPLLDPTTDGADTHNPFIALRARSAASGGTPTEAAIETRNVDQNGNLLQDSFYDWIPYSQLTHDSSGNLSGFSGGTILRSIANTNKWNVPPATNGSAPPDSTNAYWSPSGPRVLNLVASSAISGSGTGSLVQFTYDGNDNVTQEAHWDSTKAATAPSTLWSASASVTARKCDAHGNLTQLTDPNNIVTAYTYDANDLYMRQKVRASGTAVARHVRVQLGSGYGIADR